MPRLLSSLLLVLIAAPPVLADAEMLERFQGRWTRVDHELDDAARHAIRSSIGEAYPLDGQPSGGAEADQVFSRLEDGLIRQTRRHGDESHGDTFWHLDESGDRLVIIEEVHDSHFEEPIQFSTTYRRAESE